MTLQLLTKPLTVCSFFMLAVNIDITQANQYDPHVFPKRGPFFEGWYARITDDTNARSFGLVFGRVLPKKASSTSTPTTYLSFLRSRDSDESMEVIDIFPDENDISVTVRGGIPVTKNPDDKSPAYFEWVARPYGFFNVTPDGTVFEFEAHGVYFNGSFGTPVPWGPNGEGPESWLDHIAFIPLHWFVYSLATQGNYTWVNSNTTESYHGHGAMHQEKNWGNNFPPSWIWTQGVSTGQDAVYAGTFGVISFGPLDVPGHLFGYRNFNKNISLDFRPYNSIVTKTIDGCKGSTIVTITSPRYRVTVTIFAPESTLQKCLYGPTVEGFVPICVESYVANCTVTIYKLGLTGYKEIDSSIFEFAALEFGGDYMCKDGPYSLGHD